MTSAPYCQRLDTHSQDTLLVFTNAHEGDIFVDEQGLAGSNATLSAYIANLFPRMNETSIAQATSIYSTLQGLNASTVPTQATYVMGEAIFICPAFYMLGAFHDHAWKVRFLRFLTSQVWLRENARPNTLYLQHFTEMSSSMSSPST